jgi:hypothetical protein
MKLGVGGVHYGLFKFGLYESNRTATMGLHEADIIILYQVL